MDDDNFDIDIYGDDTVDDQQSFTTALEAPHIKNEDSQPAINNTDQTSPAEEDVKKEVSNQNDNGEQQQIATTVTSPYTTSAPKQAPVKQGDGRAESDDRVIDSGASTAIVISDLHWYQNDEDIRGWANQAGCEDELKDIAFNEHKVNGKSKG